MNPHDSYDLEMKEEPTCQLSIRLTPPNDTARLLATIKRFAAAHEIPDVNLSWSAPSGARSAPMYSNDNVLISTFIADFPPVPPEKYYAQITIHVLKRSYPFDRFRELAEDFHSTIKRDFGDQIQYWEEPQHGKTNIER